MSTTILNSESAVKNWWISLLLGMLYIFVGIWVFKTPLTSYISLSIIFSIFIFISGILEISFSISNRSKIDSWGWYLVGGILDLIVGILLLLNPIMTMVILPFYVGFWLLFRGIMSIGISIQLKSLNLFNWGWMLITGIVTIIFSIFVLANPIFGGLSIVYMTSGAFITMGIFRIFLGFDLKKMQKRMKAF